MPDRPRLWDATDALCWVARDILAKRMAGYPAAVEAKRLTPAEADAGLRIASAIAADWTRAIEVSPHFPEFTLQPLPVISGGEKPSPLAPSEVEGRATPEERVATLNAALAHPAVQADPGYAELIEALLWRERAHERGETPIARLNAINAELRRRARGPERAAA
jgi:hypothetical protein